MGYTHYWYRKAEYPADKFAAVLEDFKRLVPELAKAGVGLADKMGAGSAVLTPEEIGFNGPEQCGHPANTSIVIPWPAKGAGGVMGDVDPVSGSWFARAELSTRACGGDCSYETFDFPRRMGKEEVDRNDRIHALDDGWKFEFCKTAFRPYDLAVTACLIVAKHHLGKDLKVRSDGDADGWFDAAMLCQQHLGYGLDFRVDAEDEPDGTEA